MEQSDLFDWILEVKTCEQCPPGPRAACRGSASAPILIVGQAPGRQEAIEGKPFVGPAGKVLDQALISVGLSEDNVLITNPVFFAPPADRTPTPDELAHGKTHLDALIEKLKPKLIIPLGAVATHLFVSSPWGMTKLSGILQGDNVFPILHPAAILHQPQYRAQWEQAWKNLSNILKRFMTREVQEEINIIDEPWGPEQGFVHLHNHSEYSKLDGHQTVAEMLRECRRKGYRAIALTDHGTLAGWMAFYRKAKDAGIKPILGLEAYIAQTRSAKERMHLILLAENLEGYQGIIKLQTNASLNQQGTKPIIEWHELAELKGVFVLTACTGGVFGKPLLPKPFGKEDPATAKKNVQQLIDWFGKDHVFLEVQPHPTWANLPHESNPQVLLNSAAAKLATELGIGIVATNDNHYVEPDGWEIQDVLLAIRDRTIVDFPGREKYDIHDLYIKDSASILQGLQHSGLSEDEARVATSNSQRIADLCNLEIPRGKNILPPVKFPPQHLTAEAYFAQLVEDGFARLLPDKLNDEVYLARLQYELDLYTKKSFVDYMLIVWELVQWCKANDIATGPGRGSVSGSLVAYVLGITGVDPIEHDIIMERFVSEVRTDMPDIDLDVQDDKREEVIEHLRQMYGLDNVMKLGTEVRIHGRLAIRDAGKVLGIGPEELGPVTAALIYRSGGDARTNYTVEDSFQQFDVCKVFDKRHPKVRRYAVQLEGRVQYFSTHASGILMTPWPIGDWIPLERRNGEITTAWTMDDTEYLGLLKLDILGITGLNMVTTARQLIEQRHGIKLDLAQIPRDDELVMEKFAKRETSGIFQFGSLGLRRLCEQLAKAKGGKLVFSDLAVLNTLHRPAMLNIGEHTHYVYRVAGKEAVSYEHPIQEKILKATFGIAMYQEQIMMICRELGGLSWEHVGLIRKIISKRQGVEIFTKAKNTFVEGAMRNGCSEEVAGRIFDSMSHAGSYAFNKAHAVGYSMLAYQQMWLKVHFPLEYHAALLICESTIESKSDYIRSAWQAGIKILKPDVNRSRETYVIDEDSIRCGLADINGVGNIAAKAIVSKQPFSSIADLMVRVDRRVVNSRVVERLIMSGAFKSLHPNTKALLSSWKELTGEAVKQGLEKSRQTTLMGDSAYVAGAMEKLGLLVFDEEYSPDEEQDLFLSVVGFPREAHPITDYADQLKMIHPANGLTKLRQLDMDKGCDNVLVAGIVTKHNWKIEGLEGGAYREAGGDMEGHKYVHLNIEDETDFIMTHFDRFMYQRHKEQLEAPDGYPVICEGNIRAGMSKIYVGNFIALDKWAKKLERGEALTAFERRLLRHPMLDYVDTNSGVKRLWQLDMLWPLDRKVQVLGLPIWTKEKERIWQVCLQDLHDGMPYSKMVIAWPDVFGPFKEELKSQSPLLIDLVPLAEIGAWCISGRQNCKVTYAGVE